MLRFAVAAIGDGDAGFLPVVDRALISISTGQLSVLKASLQVLAIRLQVLRS